MPDADLGPAGLGPAGVEPRDRRAASPTAARRARSGSSVWLIGAPQSAMIGVADELVERAAVLEDHLHHLAEVFAQEPGHRVGAHRLGDRGEAADVAEEHGDRPALAAQPDRAVLLRDLAGDVGREVALEVRADRRLAPDPLGEAAVLDADGREAG